MKVLGANIGSTSLKYRLFDFATGKAKALAAGAYERVSDYSSAIEDALESLRSKGALARHESPDAVGFKTIIARDVTGCVELTDSILNAMESMSGVAPAHNPAYIRAVRQFRSVMPGTFMVGLFETAYYQWMPETAKRFAVPQEWHRLGVRRWGFHGASHKYVAERSAELAGRCDVAERVRRLYVDGPGADPAEPLRLVSCHLGGSASVTGARSGIAIGNSLGMSPQSGLPHNNRVGDLDSMAIPYMMRTQGMTLDQVERILATESGLKGLSGGANDVRDLRVESKDGNSDAQLALNFLVSETRRYIGSYTLELNGLDVLVFAGGIGENDPDVRRKVCRNLDYIGLKLDEELNESARGDMEISASDSRVKVFVIQTNEELVVAREVKRWLECNR